MSDPVIKLRVYIKELDRFADVEYKGVPYVIGGEQIILFQSRVMAAAVWREVRQLGLWEKEGVFPKPLWKVPNSKRCKRWYSHAQVMAVHEIHWQLSKGSWGVAHSRHFPLDEFFRRVRAVFYAVDAAAVKAARARKEKQG